MENENRDQFISDTVNDYLKNGKYNEAKEFLETELSVSPDDYWLITSLAITYYELREYDKALSLSEKALKINPRDYLVLDYHATILSVIKGKEQEATKLLRKIINTDLNKIAYGPNGEGMNWAKSIVNDCRMRLALVYRSIKENKAALMLVNAHLKNRQKGVFSNYTKKEVIKMQNSLLE